MKKTLLTALLLASAAAATAAPALHTNGSFTGAAVEVGAGVGRADIKNSGLKEKNKADAVVRGGYNVQLGQSNWISGAEVSVKPLHRTLAGDVKQKIDAGVSYVQGYRVADDVLAYGKVGYHYGKFDTAAGKTNMNGVGYGLGAKYAVMPNVEVGAEWEQTRYKKDEAKVNNNSYMATVGYRF